MIKTHEHLQLPHWNRVIWKYMSLDKFLYLLMQGKLIFNNASRFSDRNEGKIPEATQQYLRKHWREYMSEVDGDGIAFEDYIKQKHNEVVRFWLNCWSMNRNESYALWKIYLGGSKAGVAIRSNVPRLKKAIDKANILEEPDVFLSEVQYSDYMKPTHLSPWRILSTKSPHYEYERELRLIVHPDPNNPSHLELHRKPVIGISVDLNELVDELYLSPFVGRWFRKSFRGLLEFCSANLSSRIVSSLVQDE